MNAAAAKVDETVTTPPSAEVTPETIGRMSKKAIEACEHSAKLLRELGDYAGTMGEQTKEAIYQLAGDFEQHGRSAAQQVVTYANDIYAKATQAAELRKSLPQSGPRIVERG